MNYLTIPGYRIISFKLGEKADSYKDKIYNLEDNGKDKFTLKSLLDHNIHSVERLWDKTILTIGDQMIDGTIKEFLFIDNDLFYVEKYKTGIDVLCWVSKGIKKQ